MGMFDFLPDPLGLFGGGGGGSDAGDAAIQGAEINAGYQREALEYLKEREQLPQQFREGALTQMGGMYGLEGGEGSQQMMIDQARESPLYAAMMGSQQAGEESIMRNAAATGGLRSGNVQANMYNYNTQLENQALLQSYNQQQQGLQGLAGLPSMAPAIAQQTGNIGNTLAQGYIGSAQANQQSQQNQFGNLMGLGQLGLQAWGAFS